MDLKVDKHIKTPLYKQISKQIEQLVLSGALPYGYILPPERKLAEQLSVNRTTVLNAYRNLKADGIIASRVGQGTMVVYETKTESAVKKQFLPMHYDHLYANIGKNKMTPYEKRMLKFTTDKALISFSVGILRQENYPFYQSALQGLYKTYGSQLLNHTPYRGLPELISQLEEYLLPYSIKCQESNLMVTTGSQQGISLISDVFIEPGDVVVVEDPTYFLGKQVFELKGARVIGIPMETDGMDVAYLEQVLRTTKVKMIYTMPNLQNPTNYNMSTGKKTKLLQLAYDHQAIILEDGAYNDLSFDGKKPITLKSMDYNQQVIYIGTFSKVFSLGVRVGFMVAEREVIERISYVKHLRDIHTSSISQWLVYDQINSGNLQEYIKKVIVEHRMKLQYFMDEMDRLGFADYKITYEQADGGVYLWIRLPEIIDTTVLLEQAMKLGVVYAPGQLFANSSKWDHHIRVNFVYVDKVQIKEGLNRLLRAVKSSLTHKRGDMATEDSEGFAAI